MEENNIFQEKVKLPKEDDKMNNELFNIRIQTKLSLRKNKINDILYQKRFSDNIKYKWKLLYDIKNIKFISKESKDKYKLDFNDDEHEKILSLANKYLKSDNYDEIKYCIILLQIFIKRNMNNNLTSFINLLFIYDLFNIINKVNKDKEIIFNILDILINYSYINTDDRLSTILLSPNSYKIWELCFNLQDYDIFYEMICIFNNIIQDNQVGSCNLIRSNFLGNYIFNFYLNETITSQLDNKDKSSIYFYIIREGINLFCNLLIVPINNLDRITKGEVKSSKQKIIKILMKYYNCNSFDNHYKCIYSLNIAVEGEISLVDDLHNNNFIEDILINKKFFDNKMLLYQLNNIFGNYIAYKININNKLLIDIIIFESNYLDICKEPSHRKKIFWVLSNVILSSEDIYKQIFEINGLLSKIIECLKNSYSFSELREILYFFGVLLSKVNIKYFIEIEKNKLMEFIFFLIKNNFENRYEELILSFEILEIYFSFGKETSQYFQGINLIKEKFDKLGGKELLEKYINTSEEKLNKIIKNIFKNFY